MAPVARQIASALEAAHEAGIVHRDLKPANKRADIRAFGVVLFEMLAGRRCSQPRTCLRRSPRCCETTPPVLEVVLNWFNDLRAKTAR